MMYKQQNISMRSGHLATEYRSCKHCGCMLNTDYTLLCKSGNSRKIDLPKPKTRKKFVWPHTINNYHSIVYNSQIALKPMTLSDVMSKAAHTSSHCDRNFKSRNYTCNQVDGLHGGQITPASSL